MHVFLKALMGLAVASALPVAANASMVEFELTGNVTFPTSPGSGINNTNGKTFTLDVFADNGNSSLLNQTWTSADVSKITLAIGSTTYQANYTASQYGGPAYAYGTPGDHWSTDGSGNLQTTSINWVGTGNASKGPFTAFAVSQTQIENGVAGNNGNTATSGTDDTQFISGVQGNILQVYDLAGNHDNIAYDASQWKVVSPVPLPAAFPLLISGLGILGFGGLRRTKSV